MKTIQVQCLSSGCSISCDGELCWSSERSFDECAQDMFLTLRSLSGVIVVSLEDLIVKKSIVSLEHVSTENAHGVLRAQALHIVNVPEVHVRHFFVPTDDGGPYLRGMLYCCDIREVAALVSMFAAAGLSISQVTVPEHPELLFFDERCVRQERMRERRKIFAVLAIALVCGAGAHWLQKVSDLIAEHVHMKQQQLVFVRATVERLKQKVLCQEKARALMSKGVQQKKRFTSLLPGIAGVRPADILPQRVLIDCRHSVVEIEGIARTGDAAPRYVERLRRNVLSEATMTSLEHERASYRFTVAGVI